MDKYDALRQDLLKHLDEIEKNPNIQKALNKRLFGGDGDETDYNAWLKGSIKFAKDNEKLLKEFA